MGPHLEVMATETVDIVGVSFMVLGLRVVCHHTSL